MVRECAPDGTVDEAEPGGLAALRPALQIPAGALQPQAAHTPPASVAQLAQLRQVAVPDFACDGMDSLSFRLVLIVM